MKSLTGVSVERWSLLPFFQKGVRSGVSLSELLTRIRKNRDTDPDWPIEVRFVEKSRLPGGTLAKVGVDDQPDQSVSKGRRPGESTDIGMVKHKDWIVA